MERYYTRTHASALRRATTYEHLYAVGSQVLAGMQARYGDGKTVVLICGPMTTGGLGDLERNMRLFRSAINVFYGHRYATTDEVPFSQIPCQDGIKTVSKFDPTAPYDERILTDFYRRLFQLQIIKRFYFLRGWQGSRGACAEMRYAKELSIETRDYPSDLYTIALTEAGLTA